MTEAEKAAAKHAESEGDNGNAEISFLAGIAWQKERDAENRVCTCVNRVHLCSTYVCPTCLTAELAQARGEAERLKKRLVGCQGCDVQVLEAENIRMRDCLEGKHHGCNYLASSPYCNKCGAFPARAVLAALTPEGEK